MLYRTAWLCFQAHGRNQHGQVRVRAGGVRENMLKDLLSSPLPVTLSSRAVAGTNPMVDTQLQSSSLSLPERWDNRHVPLCLAAYSILCAINTDAQASILTAAIISIQAHS